MTARPNPSGGGSGRGEQGEQGEGSSWLERFCQKDDKGADKKNIDRVMQVLGQNGMEETFGPGQTDRLQDVFSALYTWAFSFNSPWMTQTTEMNKVYIAKNYLHIIKKVISFISYQDQKNLQKLAISCIWNFAENEEITHVLYELGSLPPLIEAFKKGDLNLKRSALGALWGYLEFEDIQEQAIKAGLLELIVSCIPDIDDYYLVQFMGCIQACSFNRQHQGDVVKAGVPKALIPLCSVGHDDYPKISPKRKNLLRYTAAVALAALTHHKPSQKALLEMGVLEAVKTFLETHTPHQIAIQEKKSSYSWSFVGPFFALTNSAFPLVRQLGAFCLENLATSFDKNRASMIREGLVDGMICMSWSKQEPQVSAHMKAALAQFLPSRPLSPPPLKEICLYSLREQQVQSWHKQRPQLEEVGSGQLETSKPRELIFDPAQIPPEVWNRMCTLNLVE